MLSSTNPLNVAGTAAVSSSFAPPAAGVYQMVATYPGDANWGPLTSPCNDPTETVVLASLLPPQPPKLEVTRARVLSSTRRLDVVAPISALASGRVNVTFRAAGVTTRFTAPVDSARRVVRIDRRISAAQARAGTGIVTLSYPGDADTQPQVVRLRRRRSAQISSQDDRRSPPAA